MKIFLIILLSCVSMLVTAVNEVSATEEEQLLYDDMSEPERCLNLRRIDKIKILDNQNLLFYVRGRKLYRNTLSRKCNGLNPDSIISYNASLGKLCRNDIITGQDMFGERSFVSARCTLGMFQQIPTLKELKEEK